jgi:hypothetical protein
LFSIEDSRQIFGATNPGDKYSSVNRCSAQHPSFFLEILTDRINDQIITAWWYFALNLNSGRF